jgi:hypothetical protein
LADDRKLGYGFTLADELEEVDIGPGDKPQPTFVSKKLDPSLREPMIALLKECSDCFAWCLFSLRDGKDTQCSWPLRDIGPSNTSTVLIQIWERVFQTEI